MKKYWLQLLKDLPYILVTFLGVGMAAALVAVIAVRPERWDIILQFLGLFLAPWPFVVLVLVLTFVITFREQIGLYLASKPKFTSPWASLEPPEQQEPQPETPGIEEGKETTEQALTKQDSSPAVEVLAKVLVEQAKTAQEEREGLLQEAARKLESLSYEALHWRFEYLDQFLAPATKYLLWEAAQQLLPPFRLSVLVALWGLGKDQSEVIKRVLLANGLVEESEKGLLTATQLGKRFLVYYKAKHGEPPKPLPLPPSEPLFATPPPAPPPLAGLSLHLVS